MTTNPDLICYCFGYSREDIIADARQHGHSTILTTIMDHSKAGECNCATNNPKKR